MVLGYWCCSRNCSAQNEARLQHSDHVALVALPWVEEAQMLGKVTEEERVIEEGKAEEQRNSYDLVERDY